MSDIKEACKKPVRSGKGVSCAIPTVLTRPDTIIVLDFKGENFNTCPSLRKQYKTKLTVYNPVFLNHER